jgi:hypothetical protein
MLSPNKTADLRNSVKTTDLHLHSLYNLMTESWSVVPPVAESTALMPNDELACSITTGINVKKDTYQLSF